MTMRLKHIYIFIVAMMASWLGAGAAPVTIKASLDSAYILMGKTTAITVEIVQDRGIQGMFLSNNGDTLTRNVEVVRNLPPDTSRLSDDREEIKRQVIIQSFDSGLYTIPPYVYAAGHDTFKTTPLVLKVLPVPVDTLKAIHDYADVVDPNTRIWDYLPDFVVDYWWILPLLMLIALGISFWLVYVKGRRALPVGQKKKIIPPYELAMQQLERLKADKLCENGQEKEYYTRLTEILRNYLDSRFGINAMEMTSTQILDTIRENPETKPSAAVMRQILEMADFVKFAKVRPMPGENVTAYNNAVQFVENTKPAPEPEEDSEKDQTQPGPQSTTPKDNK